MCSWVLSYLSSTQCTGSIQRYPKLYTSPPILILCKKAACWDVIHLLYTMHCTTSQYTCYTLVYNKPFYMVKLLPPTLFIADPHSLHYCPPLSPLLPPTLSITTPRSLHYYPPLSPLLPPALSITTPRSLHYYPPLSPLLPPTLSITAPRDSLHCCPTGEGALRQCNQNVQITFDQ